MSMNLKDDILNAVRDSKINHTCRAKTPKFRKPIAPPQYTPPPMPPVKPAKEKSVEAFHRVNLYLTIEDLNNYIHKCFEYEGKYASNTYIPIGATVNCRNLDLEIDCVAINPEGSDSDHRIKLEVKL